LRDAARRTFFNLNHQSKGKFSSMSTGQVKWFNRERGYGFIIQDDGNPDLFLHARALRRVGFDYTVPSQRVEYEVRENRNRPGHFMAINIRLLDPVLSKPIVAPAHGDAQASGRRGFHAESSSVKPEECAAPATNANHNHPSRPRMYRR
jgi:cold shock protein